MRTKVVVVTPGSRAQNGPNWLGHALYMEMFGVADSKHLDAAMLREMDGEEAGEDMDPIHYEEDED